MLEALSLEKLAARATVAALAGALLASIGADIERDQAALPLIVVGLALMLPYVLLLALHALLLVPALGGQAIVRVLYRDVPDPTTCRTTATTTLGRSAGREDGP